jgi:hypothetical protein
VLCVTSVTNDIVLLFDTQRDELTRIDGFRSRLVGLAPELYLPLTGEILRDIISNELPSFRTEGHEHYIWLDDEQWSRIKSAIIERNQELESVIDELEAAQQTKYGELLDDDAILFDSVRLAIEIFNSKDKRNILGSLDDARDSFAASSSETGVKFTATTDVSDLAMSQVIKNALLKTEFGEPVNALTDPFHQQMADLYSQRWNETDAINQDFQNPPEGWERNSQDISVRALQDMVRLIDPDTNRELMLMMAHQEGAGLHDLAGADLIYDTASHSSIIFVQYKRFSESNTVRPSELDQDQLNVLLNLCRHHECRSIDGSDYLPHLAIRLGDCPVYYKLLDHEPQIDSKSKRMIGKYLQACLMNQSLSETPTVRRHIIKRSLPHGMFYGLVGRTQIGSRASVYSALRQKVLDFMQNKLVYAQETELA